ncbi:MAG: hypothetical protein A2X58_10025 [Nitrospirae bacterium GWC2_56_14]|nr:MAG: hypothetical protein A2X58_10025 [Nitrospirae bacterium GWC2_56_14]
MTKTLTIMILILTVITTTSMAGNDPLVDQVLKYKAHLDRIERSTKKTSLLGLIQEGTTIADRLRPVIENLSEADYEAIEKNMKGFTVNRYEVIVIEPDTAFFATLAKKHGTDNDNMYFQFRREWMPEGFWPVYINLQTDVGGCTRFGEGYLANLYKKGNALLPKMTGYYALETAKILKAVSDQLTSGTCACADQQSVIKELKLFLELNPKAEIAKKVEKRLEDLQKQRIAMQYQCIGGR